MGRPRLEPGTKTEKFSFRVPATLLSAVDELAARRGEDRSTWTRRVFAEQVAAAERGDEEAVPA